MRCAAHALRSRFFNRLSSLAIRFGSAGAALSLGACGISAARAAPSKVELRDLVATPYEIKGVEGALEDETGTGDQKLLETILSRQKGGKDTLVEIYQEGCMACAAVHPKYKLLEEVLLQQYGDRIACFQSKDPPKQIDSMSAPVVLLFPANGKLQDAQALRMLETEADGMGVQRRGIRTVPEMLAFFATTGRARGVNATPDLSAVKASMDAEQLSRRYHNVLHASELTQWVLASVLGADGPYELDALADVGEGVDPVLDGYRGVKAAHDRLKSGGIAMSGLRESCAPCIAALLGACHSLAQLQGVDDEGLGLRLRATMSIRFNLLFFDEPGSQGYQAQPRHRRVKPEMYAAEVPPLVSASGEVPSRVLPLGLAHDGGEVLEEDCLGSPMGLVDLALDAVELELREEVARRLQQ